MVNEHEERNSSGNSDESLNSSQSGDKHSSQPSTATATEEKHIIDKIFAHPFEQKGCAKTTGQLTLQIAIVLFIIFGLPFIVIACFHGF